MGLILTVLSVLCLIVAAIPNMLEKDFIKSKSALFALILGIIIAMLNFIEQENSKSKSDIEKQELRESKGRDSLTLIMKSMKDSIDLFRNFYETNSLIYQKSKEGINTTKQETGKLANPIPNQISATVEGEFLIDDKEREINKSVF
jgi:hypothetical protein